jgi:hypothetical protein
VSGADNCSITGGYVYRGVRYPLLRGGYFYGDYCSGRIWAFPASASSPASPTLMPIAAAPNTLVSFGQDENEELYVVQHDGVIRQIIERTRYPGTGSR